jgi:hypothetical protein
MLLRSGILVAGLLCAAAARGETLAVMPVKLLDTSHEAKDQSADHARRIASVADGLAADMQGPGRYAATVLVTPEAVDAACPRETAACLIGAARDAGADDALFVVVQKSSTLIMQVFVHLIDVETNALLVARDLNFRGDNDEAWRKMEGFLARTLAASRG